MLSDLPERRTPLKLHKFTVWVQLEFGADIEGIVETLIDCLKWKDHVGEVQAAHNGRGGEIGSYRSSKGA